MNFLEDDFRKLIGLKDLVNKGQESGNFKYDLGGGYTGEDPRGTGPGYTEEGEGSQKAPPGYEGDDSETFLEKKKREEAEEAAKKEQEEKEQDEAGEVEYVPETTNINQISEASKNVDTSDPSEYSQFINANANKTVGKDSRGKIFTLGNLIRAGLFVGSGGLTGIAEKGVEGLLKTAIEQYAKKKTAEYLAEKVGLGGSKELPETALSNNLIGSNTMTQLNKGGRVKLYNGGIPGFTEAEIAQRRRQQLMDSRERNRTSYSPVPSPIAPGGIPGGDPIPPQLNPMPPATEEPYSPVPSPIAPGGIPGDRPITESPFPGTGAYTPPGGEEFTAVPGGGGSEYQTYITNLPGAGAATNLPGSGAPGSNNLEGVPMPFGMPGMPGEMTDPITGQPQDPMLAKYGVAMSDFDKMTMDQQDDLHEAVRYTEQYGREPNTQAMILKERGINPDQFRKPDGSYDRLGLTQKYMESGITDLFTKSADPVNRADPEMAEYFKIEDAKKDLIPEDLRQKFMPTGNESFRELQELEKKAYAAISEWESSMEQQYSNTPGHPFYNPPYRERKSGTIGQPTYTPGEQVKREIERQDSNLNPYDLSQAPQGTFASGGRAGFKFGSMLETSNPNFGRQKKDKSHEFLLKLLKNKQAKQLNNNLKKMVSKSRQIKDKSPEQIAKAMKKLQQLKSFYGKR